MIVQKVRTDTCPGVPLPEKGPKKEEELCPAGTVAAAVGVVAGGYIVYRCVRMLPSLFPPLWPTIPANMQFLENVTFGKRAY